MKPAPRTRLTVFLSARDVAAHLGVSTKTVRRWIKTGDLPAHRLGGQIRMAEEDVISFTALRRRSRALLS